MSSKSFFRQNWDLLWHWLPPLLWTLVVLGLSGDWGSAGTSLGLIKWFLSWIPGLSQGQMEIINFYLRKAGHVTVYGTLYFVWFRAFRGHLHFGLGRAFLWSLGLCFLVAMLDEGHQALVGSRTGSLRDVGLDLSGSGLAALITLAWWTPRPKTVPLSE